MNTKKQRLHGCRIARSNSWHPEHQTPNAVDAKCWILDPKIVWRLFPPAIKGSTEAPLEAESRWLKNERSWPLSTGRTAFQTRRIACGIARRSFPRRILHQGHIHDTKIETTSAFSPDRILEKFSFRCWMLDAGYVKPGPAAPLSGTDENEDSLYLRQPWISAPELLVSTKNSWPRSTGKSTRLNPMPNGVWA